MIVRKVDPPLYNIRKGILSIAQPWPSIQPYPLTGNIYLIGEARLEAPSRRKVSCDPEGIQTEESEMEVRGDDISTDGQLQEEEEDALNPITSSKGVYSTKGTTSGTQRSPNGKAIPGRSKPASERQNSFTRGSSKSQAASATKEPIVPCHIKRGTHTANKTATGGNPNDPGDPSGEECNNDEDGGLDRGGRSDRGPRSDAKDVADDRDRSVREITASIAEWQKVTGQRQFIRKKTTQGSSTGGLAKIKDPENRDGKSQKWRDPISFDQ